MVRFTGWLVLALLVLSGTARAADLFDPDNLIAALEGAVGKAYKEASAKLEAAKTPLEKINALYQRSKAPVKVVSAFVEISDWQRANSDIDEALNLLFHYELDNQTELTGRSNLYFQKGFIAVALKKYKDAIAAYDQAEQFGYAKEHNGNGAELWNNRGNARFNLHQAAAALADYEVAIGKDDTASRRRLRAKARFEVGDYDGAITDWHKAKELDPKTPDAPFDRELIRFNKAIAELPNSPDRFQSRAEFLLKQAEALPDGSDGHSPFDVANALFGDGGTPKKPDAKLEKLRAALSDLDYAVEIEPDSPLPYLERAHARTVWLKLPYGQGERNFADNAPLDDYERAQKIDPTFARAWFGAALFRAAPPRAKNIDLVSLAGDEKEARLNEIRAAIAGFSRAIYCAPTRSGEAHFQRALLERQLSTPDSNTLFTDYSIAIEQKMAPSALFWTSGLDTDEALVEAYSRHAELSVTRGSFQKALDDLDAALKLDENASLFFQRGRLRVRGGNYDGSIADLNEVIKSNPRFADGYFWRAVARDGKGEIEAARGDVQELLKLDESYAKRLKGSRYDAQNPTQRGIAPKPNTPDAPKIPTGTALEHKKAGNDLLLKEDVPGALAEYNASLQIDPDFADALTNRGSIYREDGKVDLALADFNRALEIDAKHSFAYYNRALLWRDLGDAKRQRADLEKAIAYAANDGIKADADAALKTLQKAGE